MPVTKQIAIPNRQVMITVPNILTNISNALLIDTESSMVNELDKLQITINSMTTNGYTKPPNMISGKH